jgi:hypothetical protein
MYCPKCGTPMERRGNELTCVAGNMGLSAALEQSLVAHFGVDSPVLAVPPLSFRVGGQWFCPTNGTPMREADGMVQCPRCARCFAGSKIYQLIEVHPHRGQSGRGRGAAVPNKTLHRTSVIGRPCERLANTTRINHHLA